MLKIRIFLIIASLVFLTACVKERSADVITSSGISFSVSEAVGAAVRGYGQEAHTRSSLTNDATPSFSFGVSEYGPDDQPVTTFQNVNPVYVSTSSADHELFDSDRPWESPAYTGTPYGFYAYSPYLSSASHGLTLLTGNKTLSYELSGVAIASQPDLMTSYASSAFMSAVPLTFEHRLAAVGLKLGPGWENGSTVSGIRFVNIITGGTLSISAGKDAAWDSYGSRGTYSVPEGFSTTASSAGGVGFGSPSA